LLLAILTHRFLLFITFLKTMGRLAEMQRKLLEVGELKLLIFVKFGKADKCLVWIGGTSGVIANDGTRGDGTRKC